MFAFVVLATLAMTGCSTTNSSTSPDKSGAAGADPNAPNMVPGSGAGVH